MKIDGVYFLRLKKMQFSFIEKSTNSNFDRSYIKKSNIFYIKLVLLISYTIYFYYKFI